MKYFISFFLLVYFLIFGIAEAQILSGDKVEKKAVNFVKSLLEKEEDTEIYATKKINNIKLPEGTVKVTVSDKKYSTIGRHYTVPVNLIINNQKYKTIYVNVRAKIYRTIIKSCSAVKKSNLIKAENLVKERTDITRIRNKDSLFTNKKEIIGMAAKNYIPQNKILTADMIEHPPLVEKKKTIKITASLGNIEATLYAVALENGKKGDVIKVMNPETKKQFFAKVIAKNLATIAF